MKDRRYAILGDIHGNLEALEAVLKDARENGVTVYVCVGDIVGYNANPSECLDILRELDCATVRGNHDHYCAYDESLDDFHPLAANVVDWTRKQLSDDQVGFLRSLKLSRSVGGFTIVHSTLDMPEKWGYVFDALEAEANFTYQTTTLCFHGHTHVPLVYERQSAVRRHTLDSMDVALGAKYFVNTGSVGQPRDGDPRAAYVIYDATARNIVLRRVEYDIDQTQAKIMAAGLPEKLAKRLKEGR